MLLLELFQWYNSVVTLDLYFKVRAKSMGNYRYLTHIHIDKFDVIFTMYLLKGVWDFVTSCGEVADCNQATASNWLIHSGLP